MTYFAFALALLFAVLLVQVIKKKNAAESRLRQIETDLQSDKIALQKTHTREIQRLLDALPYPFFSISERGRLLRYNQHGDQIFGKRDVLGRSIRQVFLDEPIVREIQQAIAKNTPITKTLRLPPDSAFSFTSEGKDSHWQIDLRPISLSSDTVEFQLMMRDITADVYADQVRQDFVANASHELRTPLAIISGYLENLTEEGGLDHKETAQRMLEVMDRHVVRINDIVEGMLEISKLESDEASSLKIITFNLADCARDISERLELMVKKQEAKLELEVPNLEMKGDRFYWTQVLFNLAENALKQNTTLPLTIKISAKKKRDGEIIIKVSDNGIGIPAADLPFIFRRFYRVEKHHSQTQVKSTGLGLSIVKRAIQAHGGNISVDSTPGEKTTFTITAPQPPPNNQTSFETEFNV